MVDLPTKESKSNTHTVVLLVNSQETLGIAEGLRVADTFSSGSYRLPMVSRNN